MESLLSEALSKLFDGRVFPDFAELGTKTPFCVYAQTGGRAIDTLSGEPPDRKNGTYEIFVASKSRKETASLMRNVEDILRQAPFYATVLEAQSTMFDYETGIRGASQEFSIWDAEPNDVAPGVVVVPHTPISPDPVATFDRTLKK